MNDNSISVRRGMRRGAGMVAGLALFALPLVSCDDAPTRATPPTVDVVKAAPDGSYVSISGTVSSAGPEQFQLDYGTGQITVEMDDWDGIPNGSSALVDDEVLVHGFIDDDFFEKRTIEASSVYVSDLGTQFYASGVDEGATPVIVTTAVVEPRLELRGTVKSISGDEFQLDTGAAVIDVNTKKMLYDPLDDEGFQRLNAGDRVSVSGQLGREFFVDLDLMADTVVTLKSAESKGEST